MNNQELNMKIEQYIRPLTFPVSIKISAKRHPRKATAARLAFGRILRDR